MATFVIAGDERIERPAIARTLGSLGHTVHETDDGAAALHLVRAHRPDLLVIDLELPGLTGFEVLDALRHDPAGARLRTVVLARQADADARLDAFEAGATEFLAAGKPPHTLGPRIIDVLERPGPAFPGCAD
jgi:CheY-like chemotaxis protein